MPTQFGVLWLDTALDTVHMHSTLPYSTSTNNHVISFRHEDLMAFCTSGRQFSIGLSKAVLHTTIQGICQTGSFTGCGSNGAENIKGRDLLPQVRERVEALERLFRYADTPPDAQSRWIVDITTKNAIGIPPL